MRLHILTWIKHTPLNNSPIIPKAQKNITHLFLILLEISWRNRHLSQNNRAKGRIKTTEVKTEFLTNQRKKPITPTKSKALPRQKYKLELTFYWLHSPETQDPLPSYSPKIYRKLGCNWKKVFTYVQGCLNNVKSKTFLCRRWSSFCTEVEEEEEN